MLKSLKSIQSDSALANLFSKLSKGDFKIPSDLLDELNMCLAEEGYKFGSFTSSKLTHRGSARVIEKWGILPNQFICYVCHFAELAKELHKYMDIWDSFEEKENIKSKTAAQISQLIKSSSKNSALFASDDDITAFSKLVDHHDDSERLGAKAFVPDKPRQSKELFTSILLSSTNLQNQSSELGAQVIYDVSRHDHLVDKIKKLVGWPLIVSRTANTFPYQVIKYLVKTNQQADLFDCMDDTHSSGNNISIQHRGIRLSSIIKWEEEEVDEDELISGNKLRFHPKPIDYIENKLYVSTEWTSGQASRLDIDSFKEIFNQLYPHLEIESTNEDYRLVNKKPNNTKGTNKIYYGAPGVGKSYSIKNEAVEQRTITTVFHAETQNSDFVGCLKPSMDNTQDSRIIYTFRPGPFVNALINATNDPAQHHWLVIEEINRAPAAAVFGEIFLLLDRNPESGASELPVTVSDPDMLHYLNSHTNSSFANGNIRLPSNLSLLATMNSSDQAVMPMDTAFKRRWQFKYMPLNLELGSPCSDGSLNVPSLDGVLMVEWRDFASAVNRLLTDAEIPEDKHLGPFFLSNDDLLENNKKDALAGKLFVYLWDDVLRHGRQGVLFNDDIKTFGQLNAMFSNNESVFNEELYSMIMPKNLNDEIVPEVEDIA